MKIKNIFKKQVNTKTAKIQSLDKKQLKKVIGGLDDAGKVVVRGWDPIQK